MSKSPNIKTIEIEETRLWRGKRIPKRGKSLISRNTSVIGDSIETMLEKLKAGEGEGSIEDRDLVYNSDETAEINPITNIRSDKMELLLEESMGKYEHNKGKHAKKVDEEKAKKEAEDLEKSGNQNQPATE